MRIEFYSRNIFLEWSKIFQSTLYLPIKAREPNLQRMKEFLMK